MTKIAELTESESLDRQLLEDNYHRRAKGPTSDGGDDAVIYGVMV